ncbi:UNVERIFIED_ORG: hypothetical protein J2Y77_002426 [Pseudomonas lini]
MVVKHSSSISQLPDTLLLLCEYRAKKRLVQGFYAIRDLIPISGTPGSERS